MLDGIVLRVEDLAKLLEVTLEYNLLILGLQSFLGDHSTGTPRTRPIRVTLNVGIKAFILLASKILLQMKELAAK
ncbi:hypothetical protein evm_012803 [Chilo suppressalis]|nr:hypothetical protein evm_012803 [Chilo suppressalis]